MVTAGCLGCQRCETGPVVTLHDGRVVCNTCLDYRLECEARGLLSLSLPARRLFLEKAEQVRGRDAVNQLKGIMTELHKKGGRGRR